MFAVHNTVACAARDAARTWQSSSSPCSAIFNNKGEITPPNEQCWVMRSVGLLSLVRVASGSSAVHNVTSQGFRSGFGMGVGLT